MSHMTSYKYPMCFVSSSTHVSSCSSLYKFKYLFVHSKVEEHKCEIRPSKKAHLCIMPIQIILMIISTLNIHTSKKKYKSTTLLNF